MRTGTNVAETMLIALPRPATAVQSCTLTHKRFFFLFWNRRKSTGLLSDPMETLPCVSANFFELNSSLLGRKDAASACMV